MIRQPWLMDIATFIAFLTVCAWCLGLITWIAVLTGARRRGEVTASDGIEVLLKTLSVRMLTGCFLLSIGASLLMWRGVCVVFGMRW